MNPYENPQEYANGQEPEYVDTNRVTSPDQKKNVAVAAGGTTLLAASAIGLGMMDDSDNVSDEDLSDASAYDSNANAVEPPLIVPIANTGGIKSMSDLDNLDTFDKAFAAARHLVGPGHYFTWHGNTYNTYYTEELDALSPNDRQAFIASLDAPAMQREVTPMPAHEQHAPHAHHAEPMLASHVEVEPVPTAENNVPEIVPMAATVGAATAYTEITPVAQHGELAGNEHTGMGPHIDSQDEYMGHPQIIGHDDVADHYDQNHDQISSHDVGLHPAE